MLMVRYCEPCNRAFPVTQIECPACGESRNSTEALALIERLGRRKQGQLELNGNGAPAKA